MSQITVHIYFQKKTDIIQVKKSFTSIFLNLSIISIFSQKSNERIILDTY